MPDILVGAMVRRAGPVAGHALGVLLPLLSIAPPAHAADAAASELPAITVTAGQADRPATDPDIPSTTESVTRDQIRNWNVINSEDALKYLPNLVVRKRYIGDQNATIAVRGTNNVQSARGLVYLDGLLVSNLLGNSYAFPPRWSMVFPEDIERVDVAYGPFSALYPGNSLGATVLVTTHMPDAFEANADLKGFTQHFDLFGVDRSFNGSEASASIGDKVGRLSYLIGVNRLESTSQPMQFATLAQSNTPATGADLPVEGAYFYDNQTGKRTAVLGVSGEGIVHTSQDQFKLKLQYDFTPTLQGGATLGYWHDSYHSDNPTFLRDAAGNPVYQGKVDIGGYEYTIPAPALAPSNGEAENWLYGLSLRTRRATGWNGQAIVSYYDVSHSVDRAAGQGGPGSGPGTATFGDGTGWKTVDLQTTYTPETAQGGWRAHWLTFGYHFDTYYTSNVTYDSLDWRAGDRAAFDNAFAGRTRAQALYAQDAWRLLPRWKLVYGLRYEDWHAYGGSQALGDVRLPYPEAGQQHVSPKASLSFEATQDLTLRASIGRAYRFPTVGELFQGRISGTNLVNNNPNLQPENDLSKELSAQWAHGNGVYRVSLFEDDVKNTIFSQTDTTVLPNVTSFQNVDRVRSRGIETSYQGQDVGIKGLDLIANAAYTRSRILANDRNPASVGKYFYRIPLWRANVAGTYHIDDRASVTGAVRYSGRQYNTLTNEDSNPNVYGGTSTYAVADAKFTYRLNRHADLSLGIDNIFDKRYFVYHPYPGRTVYLETKLRL
ncbi:TonB-dependent receptor [Pigmentiphaga soli]|uniref:TonB-dependent receptor n=1 Tax=Pigmentiphaga soli TaxID=1007095 RepID=A0ABP8H0T7_9BURK